MITRKTIATLILALLAHATASGYEAEDAVPLTVGASLGKLRIERLAIRLNGRSVDIETTIRNDEPTRQTAGFHASTPFFQQLGDGEAHADKTFADLRITYAGKPQYRPASTRRGYFMGQDITRALARAGIDPLPDNHVSERSLAKVRFPLGLRSMEWDGFVAHAWSETVPAGAAHTITIRYRALPQFSLDTTSSDSFRHAVQQHCGDPVRVGRAFGQDHAQPPEVMIERYDVPIRFMKMQDVSIQVAQPARNWLGAHPVVALVCGLPNPDSKANVAGTLVNANKVVSVLVISRLAEPGERNSKENVE